MISERTRQAMDRNVAFWERRMSDQILASFDAEGDVTLSAVLMMDGKVSEEYPALYDDVPRMLRDFEAGITHEELRGNDGIWDDDIRIPQAWPELQFGNGMPGALFGAKVITTSTGDHTYTFNEPGAHTIQWKGGGAAIQGALGLESNVIRLEIVKP